MLWPAATRVVAQLITLAMASLALASCAAKGIGPDSMAAPQLQITGVEIHNALPYPVKDVSILVPATGEFVSCGQIFPESSCASSFPARDYRENPVQISWTEHGQPHSTKPFSLKPPSGAYAGQSAYIRVEVFATGQAGATLVLEVPGTD